MSTTQPKFLRITLQSPTLPLLLRTPTLQDAPAIQALLGNPLNTDMDNHESKAKEPPSLEAIQSRISAWRDAAAAELPGRLNLVVADANTSELVGLSGFGHIATLADGTRSGNVGIMLNPEARGKGFGAEAIRMCVEWGFQECGFAEESVGTLERNAGMVRIVERMLVPKGWRGVRKQLESGELEWELKITREEWEEEKKKVGSQTS